MKKITQFATGLAVLLGMVASVSVGTQASAINVFNSCSDTNADTAVCKAQDTDSATKVVKTITAVILWALGVVSVIMVIIGGFMYVISSGDAGRTKTAKNTILYAVIGLVVALAAYAIVQFVVGSF